ncbi:MAG: hypothetical protein KJ706_02555 [Candidatus Omnitrophica bacterium]|nr:hypothetical protein [Candidatus Omnitrophota bacterium]
MLKILKRGKEMKVGGVEKITGDFAQDFNNLKIAIQKSKQKGPDLSSSLYVSLLPFIPVIPEIRSIASIFTKTTSEFHQAGFNGLHMFIIFAALSVLFITTYHLYFYLRSVKLFVKGDSAVQEKRLEPASKEPVVLFPFTGIWKGTPCYTPDQVYTWLKNRDRYFLPHAVYVYHKDEWHRLSYQIFKYKENDISKIILRPQYVKCDPPDREAMESFQELKERQDIDTFIWFEPRGGYRPRGGYARAVTLNHENNSKNYYKIKNQSFIPIKERMLKHDFIFRKYSGIFNYTFKQFVVNSQTTADFHDLSKNSIGMVKILASKLNIIHGLFFTPLFFNTAGWDIPLVIKILIPGIIFSLTTSIVVREIRKKKKESIIVNEIYRWMKKREVADDAISDSGTTILINPETGKIFFGEGLENHRRIAQREKVPVRKLRKDFIKGTLSRCKEGGYALFLIRPYKSFTQMGLFESYIKATRHLLEKTSSLSPEDSVVFSLNGWDGKDKIMISIGDLLKAGELLKSKLVHSNIPPNKYLSLEQRISSINLDTGMEEAPELIAQRISSAQRKVCVPVDGYGFVFGRIKEDELIYVDGVYKCAAVTLLAKDKFSKRIKGAAHLFMNDLDNVSYIDKLLRVIENEKLQEVVAICSFSGGDIFKEEAEQERELERLGKIFTDKGVGFIGFMRSQQGPPARAWKEYNSSAFSFCIQKENELSSRTIFFDDSLTKRLFTRKSFKNTPPLYIVRQKDLDRERFLEIKKDALKRLEVGGSSEFSAGSSGDAQSKNLGDETALLRKASPPDQPLAPESEMKEKLISFGLKDLAKNDDAVQILVRLENHEILQADAENMLKDMGVSIDPKLDRFLDTLHTTPPAVTADKGVGTDHTHTSEQRADKSPMDPGSGTHGTIEKPREIPAVTLERQTGAPIMRGPRPFEQPTSHRLSPWFGTAEDGSEEPEDDSQDETRNAPGQKPISKGTVSSGQKDDPMGDKRSSLDKGRSLLGNQNEFGALLNFLFLSENRVAKVVAEDSFELNCALRYISKIGIEEFKELTELIGKARIADNLEKYPVWFSFSALYGLSWREDIKELIEEIKWVRKKHNFLLDTKGILNKQNYLDKAKAILTDPPILQLRTCLLAILLIYQNLFSILGKEEYEKLVVKILMCAHFDESYDNANADFKIGIPYIEPLSPKAFIGALAHEIAHNFICISIDNSIQEFIADLGIFTIYEEMDWKEMIKEDFQKRLQQPENKNDLEGSHLSGRVQLRWVIRELNVANCPVVWALLFRLAVESIRKNFDLRIENFAKTLLSQYKQEIKKTNSPRTGPTRSKSKLKNYRLPGAEKDQKDEAMGDTEKFISISKPTPMYTRSWLDAISKKILSKNEWVDLSKGSPLVIDFGCGFRPYPIIKFAELLRKINRQAQVLGIDISLPKSLVIDGGGRKGLFDEQGNLMMVINPEEIALNDGDYVCEPEELKQYSFLKDIKTSLEKNIPPGSKEYRNYRREKIIVDPYESISETDNISFRRGDFEYLKELEPDSVRVFFIMNVLYYYQDQASYILKHFIEPIIEEGGIVVDSYIPYSGHKEGRFIVQQKIRGELVIVNSGYFNGREIQNIKSKGLFAHEIPDDLPRLDQKLASGQTLGASQDETNKIRDRSEFSTNPGPGSHGTFEKPEEAPVVTLARQTGAPIMRTSLMDVPQLTDRRLSPLYGTADNTSSPMANAPVKQKDSNRSIVEKNPVDVSYAAFQREIRGEPMPLVDDPLSADTLRNLQVTNLLAPHFRNLKFFLTKYFISGGVDSWKGKLSIEPMLIERIKHPFRNINAIRSSHNAIRAISSLPKKKRESLRKHLDEYYKYAYSYTDTWYWFYKILKGQQQERRENTEQLPHKALIYLSKMLKHLAAIREILSGEEFENNLKLPKKIDRLLNKKVFVRINDYFTKYPIDKEDIPDGFLEWFREAKEELEYFPQSLTLFWQCISGLHDWKKDEKLSAVFCERVRGFVELEESFSKRERDKLRNMPQRLIVALKELKFAMCGARMILEGNYTMPETTEDSGIIRLEGAWNPIAGHYDEMDKLDIDIGTDTNLFGITGENEIGKSTTIEMIGLCLLYHQMGLPVPAKSATLGIFRNIYTIAPTFVGLEKTGESQHTELIRQITDLIGKAGPRDVVIVDEAHMGSDYKDLSALTAVLMQDLVATGATIIYATHLKSAMKILADSIPYFKPSQIVFKEQDDRRVRRLIEGVARQSFCIETLKRLNFPREIIAWTEQYYKTMAEGKKTKIEDDDADSIGTYSGGISYRPDQDMGALDEACKSLFPDKNFYYGFSLRHVPKLQQKVEKCISFPRLAGCKDRLVEKVDFEAIDRNYVFRGHARVKAKGVKRGYIDIEPEVKEDIEEYIDKLDSMKWSIIGNLELRLPALKEMRDEGFISWEESQEPIDYLEKVIAKIRGSVVSFDITEETFNGRAEAYISQRYIRDKSKAYKKTYKKWKRELKKEYTWIMRGLYDSGFGQIDFITGIALSMQDDKTLHFAEYIGKDKPFIIKNAYSPFIPKSICTPINLKGDNSHPQFIITGPNKSGKTKAIQTFQALVLLARKGWPVPAEMQIPDYDKVLTFFGAEEDVSSGASYFKNVAKRLLLILYEATPRSLILMDELHGSDYWELSALQAAIIKYFDKIGATVVLNTHMREGLRAAGDLNSLKFLKTDVTLTDDDRIVYHYSISEDPNLETKSYGIETVRNYLTKSQYQRAIEFRKRLTLEAKMKERLMSFELEGLAENDDAVRILAELENHEILRADAEAMLKDIGIPIEPELSGFLDTLHATPPAVTADKGNETAGRIATDGQEDETITSNQQILTKVLFNGWQKIAENGDLDTIRKMNRFEFARAIGVKEIKEKGMAEKVYGVLVVDDALWKEVMTLIDDYDSDPEGTDLKIRQGKYRKIIVFLAVCEEVNNPGLYYSIPGIESVEKKTGTRFGKSQFIHEYFEKVIADAGLDDKDMLSTLGHSSIEVLKAEVQFALLMGKDEFLNFLSMRTKEIEAHTILSLVELQSTQIEKSEVRKGAMRQLANLFSEAKTDKFKEESYALWAKVSKHHPASTKTVSGGPKTMFDGVTVPETVEQLRKTIKALGSDNEGIRQILTKALEKPDLEEEALKIAKECNISLDVVGDYVGQPLASGEIKLPTNPGQGSHGTFEKLEEAPVVTLARQTGAPIMRTPRMGVPQLTDRRLSPFYGTADNGSGKSNEIEKSLIKECQQGIRFPYRREWIPHIKRNKRNIMRGVKGLKGGTAILLGTGACINEPLKNLAKKFKVILVDFDEEGMQKAKEGLPKKLQEKIIIKKEDITGVSLDIMKEAKLIIEEKYSDDEEGAFNALRELLLKNSAIDAVILPELTASCDFVISSLVISELGHMPLSYIKKKVRKHFGDSSIKRFESPRWNEVENRFISAMEKAHARLLRNLVKDGGRVFVSSTTLEYNTESINLFDSSKFRTSGVERKIHYNDLRKILEENFIIKEEDAWDWVIRPSVKLVKIVLLGLSYKVRSYILHPDKKFAIEKGGGNKLETLRLMKCLLNNQI